MLKKHGKFFADWIDERGHRRRRAFATKHKALRFQASARSESAAKKARASEPSAKSAKRGPGRSAPRPRTRLPKK
jgi:hypothetical protein